MKYDTGKVHVCKLNTVVVYKCTNNKLKKVLMFILVFIGDMGFLFLMGRDLSSRPLKT